MIAALLSIAVGAADACAAVEPASAPDPAAAARYRQVGDAERAAGSRDTAVIAYRTAAALDPGDTASHDALRALCAGAATQEDAFREGLRRMQSGDLRGAIAALEPLEREGDPSAALLGGVCRFELGEFIEADRLLREAESAPEHRHVAAFYRGLIALRRGDGPQAATLFDAASVNPALSFLAADLARVAHRNGKLVLSFLAQSGLDSNVPLAPSGPSSSTGGGMMGGGSGAMMNGDGLYGLAATALYRPTGVSGPYLRGGGFLQRNFRLDSYDTDGVEAAGGMQIDRGGRGLAAEYAYQYRGFGGAPYLSANRLLGSGWITRLGLTWGLTYFAQLEDYRSSSFSAFSGVMHRADVRSTRALGGRGWLTISYRVARDVAKVNITRFTEHGPQVDLRVLLSPRVRVGVGASLGFRGYDAFDATLGARRRDTYVDGAAFGEYDLRPNWTARLSLQGRRATSNVAAFEYDKVVPMLGLVYVIGM